MRLLLRPSPRAYRGLLASALRAFRGSQRLWPTLALLLYVTFVQMPLLHLREAVRDHPFVAAVLGGNFILLPLLVWGLLALLPPDPVLRVSVALVLLVPCTDWFISFSALGGGDTPRAIAVTPLNLLAQLFLLPFYLWLMAGPALKTALVPANLVPGAAVVLVPLAAAALTERWIEARRGRAVWREKLAWWPVPLLAVVVFLIAGAQVGAVRAAVHLLPVVVPVFLAFLVLAALLAKAIALAMKLPTRHGRTLAYSLGTRNSFVVLPLALALPAGWEPAVVVIGAQSLVELFGMMFYLWWLPGRLFREQHPAARLQLLKTHYKWRELRFAGAARQWRDDTIVTLGHDEDINGGGEADVVDVMLARTRILSWKPDDEASLRSVSLGANHLGAIARLCTSSALLLTPSFS